MSSKICASVPCDILMHFEKEAKEKAREMNERIKTFSIFAFIGTNKKVSAW